MHPTLQEAQAALEKEMAPLLALPGTGTALMAALKVLAGDPEGRAAALAAFRAAYASGPNTAPISDDDADTLVWMCMDYMNDFHWNMPEPTFGPD